MSSRPLSSLPADMEVGFDDRYGGAVILDDSNQFPDQMTGGTSPHIGLAGVVLLLIGLKYYSDQNFLTTDLKEVRFSAFNTVSVGLQAFAFLVFAKLALFKLAATAPSLPLVNDLTNLFAFI